MNSNWTRNKYLLISVIGSHAGEDVSTIFTRKQKEIEQIGISYWLLKSFRAKTATIQELCITAEKKGESVYCLFIESSQKNGARPTTYSSLVQHLSHNNEEWNVVPKGITITGKIDKQSTALVLDEIQIMSGPTTFDLWEYSEYGTHLPLKLQLGASTICCERIPSIGMKSRVRNVVAIGKLHTPYAVWVR